MFIIDTPAVPWKNIQQRVDIRQAKINFLEAPLEIVPVKFRGIREYIKVCNKTEYL